MIWDYLRMEPKLTAISPELSDLGVGFKGLDWLEAQFPVLIT